MVFFGKHFADPQPLKSQESFTQLQMAIKK
jgi:hypothetical protein